jgi:hypothetical protein
MISKSDHVTLVGLTTIGIQKRQESSNAEDALRLRQVLVGCGVSDSDAEMWAGELIYNEGDEAARVVDRVLGILDVEVEAE